MNKERKNVYHGNRTWSIEEIEETKKERLTIELKTVYIIVIMMTN